MRHYRTVSMVLAAGASRELGVPTSHEMVKAFDHLMATSSPRRIPRKIKRLYLRIRDSLELEPPMDFEAIFDRISLDPEDPDAPGTPEEKESLFRILRNHFGELLLLLDGTAAGNYLRHLRALPFYLGYTLHVLTLNQDLGVELSRGLIRIDLGFSGYGPGHLWNRARLLMNGRELMLCLHKLHGSVNWQRTPDGQFFAVDPSKKIDVSKAVLVVGHKAKTPSRLPYTFEHQVDIFHSVSPDLVVVVGFSFRDPHVNEMLLDALRRGADILVVTPETPASQEMFQEHAREETRDAVLQGLIPGRILLLRKTAKEFFTGLPESLQLGTPADGNGA